MNLPASFKSCPRMGATPHRALQILCILVSSHAPVWGQRPGSRHPTGWAAFQVMPPYGGNVAGVAPGDPDDVSSHAPVWGQPDWDEQAVRKAKFQVMPPYGGNPAGHLGGGRYVCFKSCPRMGATLVLSGSSWSRIKFQVMPPYGGNTVMVFSPMVLPKFQVMPPYGGNALSWLFYSAVTGFQVMPPYGGNR